MRRPLRILTVLLVAALPLLLVAAADLPLVPAAEARLEERARTGPKAASVQAQMGTFPVVGRALLAGEVATVDLTWLGAEIGEIQATSLHFHLEGVGFDRGELFSGDARITGVESGEVRMLIAPSQLGILFEREVVVEGDRIYVQLTPQTRGEVEVAASHERLVLTTAGLPPVTTSLGRGNIPCAPSAEVEKGNLVLRCTFEGLPPIVRFSRSGTG